VWESVSRPTDTGCLFPRAKVWSGCDADHSPLSGAKVKNK
jgi:hypothetical protein